MSSSSEEEEELLVHVEFNGMLEKDVLDRNPELKVIGIEGRRPVMQIGNQTFIGKYHDIVGTSLFFEGDQTPAGGDPVFSKNPEHQLRYVCKTRKMLEMSRVFLKRKDVNESKAEAGDEVRTGEMRYLQTNSSDELTMEVDEDPVLLHKKSRRKSSSVDDMERLVQAVASGTATEEVEEIVTEQMRACQAAE